MSGKFLNQITLGDSLALMRELGDESVDLAVTSPPYWNAIDYGFKGQVGQSSYEKYISDLLDIWKESFRVLKPNGKLCINTPILPISKELISDQHTRHLKNINNDIEQSILGGTAFCRYSLYIWKKQTSVKMFGSYPYPPNIYEDNTVEFVNVFVKPGKPKILPKEVKVASEIPQDLWLELTKQIWPIYPKDVKRAGGHPAPFPLELPARLILMYSFKEKPEKEFAGDTVLDMFNGTGATCEAAQLLGRNFIGFDLSKKYVAFAKKRIALTDSLRGRVSPWDLVTKTPNSWFLSGEGKKKKEQKQLI